MEEAPPSPAPTGIILARSAADPPSPDRTLALSPSLRPPHRPRARRCALRSGLGEAAAAAGCGGLVRPVAPRAGVLRRRPGPAAAAASAEAGRLPPPAGLAPQAAQAPPHASPPADLRRL